MIFKGYSPANRLRLQKRMAEMQYAGKTDEEIAATLGLTRSAVQSLVLFLQAGDDPDKDVADERQSRLAYELWTAGKTYTEIGQYLNISRPRACQIIHKHAWLLRQARH